MTRCLDSDGAHINCLILTLFVKHLPELIKNGKIYAALPPLYKAKQGRKNTYFYSNEELEKSGYTGELTRYKGIGEMNENELWETTMNPETRKLIKLTTDNFEETLQLFETLMGSSSSLRRDFIESNNLLNEQEDYFGDEGGEE